MAHTKLLVVHSAVLTTALQQYLGTAPTIHPAVAGSLMGAVQAHIKDDSADLGGLPPDAHIVGHSVSSAGEVSLIIESQTFPWSPDGLPLAKMPVFTPTAAPAPATAAVEPAEAVVASSSAPAVHAAAPATPHVAAVTAAPAAAKTEPLPAAPEASAAD